MSEDLLGSWIITRTWQLDLTVAKAIVLSLETPVLQGLLEIFIHSLVNAITRQELNVEVRGLVPPPVHNWRFKREMNKGECLLNPFLASLALHNECAELVKCRGNEPSETTTWFILMYVQHMLWKFCVDAEVSLNGLGEALPCCYAWVGLTSTSRSLQVL